MQGTAESIAARPSDLLRVEDLGSLRITLGGKPLEAEGPSSGRARELLLLLLAHPEGMSREEAGLELWPDATTEQVKNSFHVTLHRLRKLLGTPDSILNEDGRYHVSRELGPDVVSREFEKRTTAALRGNDVEALEAALSLYAGDYLGGEPVSEWADPIRTRLRLLYVRGRFALGQALEAKGLLACAADSYAEIIARDGFHEAAYRRLMVSRARLGFRSEALHLYRELEDKLRSELDSTPEGETRALFRRLQANEAV
jgi:DNA-binding SARP family transcriptional activator